MKDPSELIIRNEGNSTRITEAGKIRYELLLDSLSKVCKDIVNPSNREALQKLAWSLGVDDQEEACEVIAEAVKKPEPVATPWGYIGM